MAFPPLYAPSTNFTDLAASLGIPRDRLDVEFTSISTFCAGLLQNLQQVQRSDGALANGVVTLDALSAGVKAAISGGWTPQGQWQGPGVKYEEGDYVEVDGLGYVCVIDHVSGADFSLDRVAGKWQSGFALSILQTQPEINTFAAAQGQTNFTLNSEIGANDAVLVYVNSQLTADFTTTATDVVLDAPATLADEIVVAHFRVVDQSLVNTLFQARDEAEAAAAAAADSETQAAISEAQAVASEARAVLAEANSLTSEQNAQSSEQNAALSETNAAQSATLAESESINASLAEDNVVRRILPGRYATFAAAAASPYAADGAFFVYEPDGGLYYFNTVSPLDVRTFAGLDAGQSASLAAVPVMKAALNRFDGLQVSGGAANAYTATSPAGQALAAYANGVRVAFQVAVSNTGAATLDVDGRGAIPITKLGGQALKAGDLIAGQFVEVVYGNGAFHLQTPNANANARALEALNGVADRLPYFSGVGQLALATLTAQGRALVDDASAAAQRSTLGLGALAVLNLITSAQFDDILPVSKGGTGASSAAAAQAALGVTQMEFYTDGNYELRIRFAGAPLSIQFGIVGPVPTNSSQTYPVIFRKPFAATPVVFVSGNGIGTSDSAQNIFGQGSVTGLEIKNLTVSQNISWLAAGIQNPAVSG